MATAAAAAGRAPRKSSNASPCTARIDPTSPRWTRERASRGRDAAPRSPKPRRGNGVRHARQPRQRLGRSARGRAISARRFSGCPRTPARTVAAGAPRARDQVSRGASSAEPRGSPRPPALGRRPATVPAATDGAARSRRRAHVALARARASWQFHLMADGADQPRLPRRQAEPPPPNSSGDSSRSGHARAARAR